MRLVLIVILGLAPIYFLAQLISESGTISVQIDASLSVQGSLQTNAETHLDVAGPLILEKDLRLEGSCNFGAAASITFQGNLPSQLLCLQTIPSLYIQKESADVLLLEDLNIEDLLFFETNETHLDANGSDIRFLPNAEVEGFHKDAYILTSQTEAVIKEDLSLFTFPVGTASAFTPIELEEKGENDDKTVRLWPEFFEHPVDQSHPIHSEAVAVSWQLEEEHPGGSLLDITVQWDAALQS